MVPLEPFKNKVFKPRRQVPGKRSLPGRPLEAQDPGKRSLPGRPTRASQRTCRDAPRVPAGPGERQAPGRGKTTAAASNHSVPALQLTHLRVALGPFQAYVAGGCAARGTLWHAAPTRSPSWQEEAPLTVPFLHCLGDVDRHLMPLSPAVRVRYDSLCRLLYLPQHLSIFALAYIATCWRPLEHIKGGPCT